MNNFLFGIYPYIALGVGIMGSVARYDRDPFTWKSSSSQLLRRRQLILGSILFHVGVLVIFLGHFVGLLTPIWVFDTLGISHSAKQILAVAAGGIAGVMALVGALMLFQRRWTDPRIRGTSSFGGGAGSQVGGLLARCPGGLGLARIAGDQDMRHLPQRRAAEPGRVARPFGVDLGLGGGLDRDGGVEKAPDQGLLLGLEASRAKLGRPGFHPAPPRLLQKQRADGDGVRRLAPGDAGLAAGGVVVLGLGGDQRMGHQLAVDDQIGEQRSIHQRYSAGLCWAAAGFARAVTRSRAAATTCGAGASGCRRRERTIW